ncbi:hypothetical protein SNOG_15031 [Parastagonospora nodorum SN15]|uniref:Uncharacterized protein n=1 Tax=Phaeosphaeria nodorum (strain SN15 / ATCC MYA-4574 / FGSC 10173) TaxID=321614 RepID=Q0TZL6_PHANO|nr:hypothetical protein SNOG_15031 [Parastagonospora nodorum SN15]EAT77574.1 hypothetical protein SNOG_15031 [Parastagonospora nodorum SN15]
MVHVLERQSAPWYLPYHCRGIVTPVQSTCSSTLPGTERRGVGRGRVPGRPLRFERSTDTTSIYQTTLASLEIAFTAALANPSPSIAGSRLILQPTDTARGGHESEIWSPPSASDAVPLPDVPG